ncbi:MAG: hypothetical protein M3N29_04240 [Chloroflexota bacterium]|nr:hypothetical protein [Chloroflexota bacterium]
MSDGELRATADKMLEMLQRLRDLEQEKRNAAIGSPEFVRLAEEAEKLARVVFRWSQMQLQLAHAAATGHPGRPPNVRLTDIEPRPLDRILADWREAQLRLETGLPGSAEAQHAVDDVERLREEFRAAQRGKRRDEP